MAKQMNTHEKVQNMKWGDEFEKIAPGQIEHEQIDDTSLVDALGNRKPTPLYLGAALDAEYRKDENR